MLAKACRLIGSIVAVAVTIAWLLIVFLTVVKKHYDLTPTGSAELQHAIGFAVFGALIAGALIYWPFKALADWLERTRLRRPSPVHDVIVTAFAETLFAPFRLLPINHPLAMAIYHLRNARYAGVFRKRARRLLRRCRWLASKPTE